MGTSWYSDFGKMITMNGMLIIFRMLIKIGKGRGMEEEILLISNRTVKQARLKLTKM